MNKFGIPQSVLDAARGILNKQPVQEDMSVHVAPHADGKSYTVKKVGSAMQKHGGVKPGEKLSDTDIDDLRDSDVTVHHMKEEKCNCDCGKSPCVECGKDHHMKKEEAELEEMVKPSNTANPAAHRKAAAYHIGQANDHKQALNKPGMETSYYNDHKAAHKAHMAAADSHTGAMKVHKTAGAGDQNRIMDRTILANKKSVAARTATQTANESVDLDEVLDTPKAMQSYRDKARASKEKAASSAVAKINKGMEKGHRAHPAGELNTIAKRAAGERMANKKSTTNEEDDFGKNFGKRVAALVKGGKSAEYLKKKADQTRQQNKDLDPGAAKKGLGIGVIDKDKANKKRMAREEAKDLDTDNVDKALQHDCASHVVHKEWGEGQCIPGMHTLVEMEDGSGYVTHYDVLFNHGIEEDVAVEDLEIVKEMSHGHPRKKKKMSEMSSKEKMKKGLYNSKMDPVGQEDDDVDNDGDSDSSDEYLKKRRKAISAAMSKKKVTEASEPQSTGQAGNMAKHYYQLAKKARDSGNQESASKFMSLAKSFYRKSETMKDRNVQGKQQQVGELYWSDQELEHLNQIDEISTKTLQSYMSKASDARGHRGLPTKKVDNRYAGVKKASDELDKRNKMNEASVVNGVTKKPGEKTWKSTSMSHDDAVKMHGKDKVRIGPRKTGLGKDDVQVHVEASGVRVTKAAKEEPEHIGVQLRKVANIGVNHSGVEFKNGSKEKVSVATANAAMRRYNAAKPAEKEQLQKHMSHSHDALKHIAKGGSLADSPATEKKHPMSAQSK